jgi:hypothetical protein
LVDWSSAFGHTLLGGLVDVGVAGRKAGYLAGRAGVIGDVGIGTAVDAGPDGIGQVAIVELVHLGAIDAAIGAGLSVGVCVSARRADAHAGMDSKSCVCKVGEDWVAFADAHSCEVVSVHPRLARWNAGSLSSVSEVANGANCKAVASGVICKGDWRSRAGRHAGHAPKVSILSRWTAGIASSIASIDHLEIG